MDVGCLVGDIDGGRVYVVGDIDGVDVVSNIDVDGGAVFNMDEDKSLQCPPVH